LTLLLALASFVTSGAEDLELRDLDVAGWDYLDRAEGTAKTRDGIERNRMKNRPPDNHTARPVESLVVQRANHGSLKSPLSLCVSITLSRHRKRESPAKFEDWPGD
jgi:hypothetical protein